jgi:hypothetical protein
LLVLEQVVESPLVEVEVDASAEHAIEVALSLPENFELVEEWPSEGDQPKLHL